MGKIYTKKGDNGNTKTFKGPMSKGDQLATALGTIDELNSWIGMLVFGTRYTVLGIELHNIQTNLMIINSILAGSIKHKFENSETKKLEKIIDKLQEELPELKNFIYPVGFLQVARAVCRRTEREVVTLFTEHRIPNTEYQKIFKYLNRLSDALFVMARYDNMQRGILEEVWK
jgi:cob(I)alamin adenosyltransferase